MPVKKSFLCKENDLGIFTLADISPSVGDYIKLDKTTYQVKSILYDLNDDNFGINYYLRIVKNA